MIHPFVYLLPIIFLFGVRRTPGVLATLVFALPPIVRLTNLGLRQVREDVVEAARAFGATESRVLREVQLPLARPAIMAGLNQTLLRSLSMVGIVAIIAGGGLGKPILTALNTADIPLGASAGAGLYFVGVLLDRISQPGDNVDRRSLFARMRDAWTTRTDPPIPPMPGMEPEPETVAPEAAPAAPGLATSHRLGAVAALAGGLLAAVSVLLTWGRDAGLLSGWARFDDTDLPGLHSGVDATGGSWFGILLGVVGLAAALGGAVAALRTSSGDEPARVGTRGVIGIIVLTLFLGLAGASGSWILDQRSDAAQIAAELAAEAEGVEQGGLAAEVVAQTRRVTVRGFDADGPGIGYTVLALTLAATAVALGRIVRRSATQQFLGMVMFGPGCAITAIGFAWIATFVRLATPALSPGASSFLVVVGGLIFAAWGWRASRPA